MRMNEATILPFGPFRTKTLAQGFFSPWFIIPEVSDHLVLLVEQGDAGMKVGHQHDVALHVYVGGKKETALGTKVLAVHVEPLEAFVGPVADNEFRGAVAVVEPLTVRSLKLAVRSSASTDCTKVVVLGGELMDVATTITITEKVATIRRETYIGWAVAPGVLATQFPQELLSLLPNHFPVQGHLGKAQAGMTGRQVDIFRSVFVPNVYAMSATDVNFAHGFDKLTILVENENGTRLTRMSNVDEARLVDGNAMRGVTVGVTIWQFTPSVLHGVLKFTFAEHKSLFRFGGE